MHRYFLEVAYKGTNYSGFQIQNNGNTIQAEVEKALAVLVRQKLALTGSSRTDAGVHALQNYFHLDTDILITEKNRYNINSILPADITLKAIYQTDQNSHCRFDAVSREYRYFIYLEKNPFLTQTAYYYPFRLDFKLLQQAAEIVEAHTDFTSFSKRNTQVKTFDCNISQSIWSQENDCIIYNVTANRFLRGMVRGLVATMLKVSRGVNTLDELKLILESKNAQNADFSAPPQGLFLMKVNYPAGLLHRLK